MDYIQSRINNSTDDGLSLDLVAQAACMSPFHFHKVFKASVGETVADYIRRLKLERAAGLCFYFKQASITDIALTLGFSSSQNLAKSFKKQFSLTPTDIRKLDEVQQLTQLIRHHAKNGNAINPHLSYSDDSHITQWKSQNMETALSSVAGQSAGKTINHLTPLQLVDLPERQVIYQRLIGEYGNGLQQASANLQAYCQANNIAVSDPLVINWDNPKITDPSQCRTDVCLTLTDDCENPGSYNLQTIPAATHAVMSGLFDLSFDYEGAWQQLFETLFAQELKPLDAPCYKVMNIGNSDLQKGLFDIRFCQAVEGKG